MKRACLALIAVALILAGCARKAPEPVSKVLFRSGAAQQSDADKAFYESSEIGPSPDAPPPKSPAELKAYDDARKAKAAYDASIAGSYIKTTQSQLCDGRLDTFVEVQAKQSISFPASKTGLLINVLDSNHLGQLCGVGLRKSLYDGWNDLPASDKPLIFTFGVGPGESSMPIKILEVRARLTAHKR